MAEQTCARAPSTARVRRERRRRAAERAEVARRYRYIPFPEVTQNYVTTWDIDDQKIPLCDLGVELQTFREALDDPQILREWLLELADCAGRDGSQAIADASDSERRALAKRMLVSESWKQALNNRVLHRRVSKAFLLQQRAIAVALSRRQPRVLPPLRPAQRREHCTPRLHRWLGRGCSCSRRGPPRRKCEPDPSHHYALRGGGGR
jgi:hypothetical protein